MAPAESAQSNKTRYDTFCMNLHLEDLSRSVSAEVQVVLVLDNAGWHVSKGLRVPPNITLVPLPPYSPELNAMEPAWLFLKSHYLANRVYADHHALFAAGAEAWNLFTQDPRKSPLRLPCRMDSNGSFKLDMVLHHKASGQAYVCERSTDGRLTVSR